MKKSLLIGLSVLSFSCQKQIETYDLKISSVGIIDIQQNQIIPDQTILISDDRIIKVLATDEAGSFEGKQEIDGTDLFIMPGLWDNHVHFGGAEYIDENEQLLPLYLSLGVTSVRDAAGDISLDVLKWRNEIQSGHRLGPELYTSGPKLEGKGSIWPGDLEIETEEELELALDSLQQLQVDFIKITDNALQPNLFLKAVKESSTRGWSVSAHIPSQLELFDLADAGLTTVEHLGYITRIKADSEAETLKNLEKLRDLGTGIVPTLLISDNIAYWEPGKFEQDTMLDYLGPKLKESYSWRIERLKNDSPESRQDRVESFEAATEMLPLIQQSGMKIYAGTDAGYLNSYDYPGWAIHLELEKMVQYGLTPQQALTASVINGPSYFKLDSYGSVSAGKIANLLLLKENPLEDIKNTRAIEAVIFKGKVFDRDSLDQIQKKIKNWVDEKEKSIQ